MIKGDWEHKNRVIEYLTNTHGFLERFTHLDNVYYIITGKGLKQIKGDDTVANNGKGETVKKREKRILEYLEDSIKPKKKKEITKYLKRYEPLINYDVTYQTLRELEERGEVEHYQIKRVNYYHLPLKGVKEVLESESDPVETTDETLQPTETLEEETETRDVVVHEPVEILNKPEPSEPVDYDDLTTGQILDLIINTYKELPPQIQNQTQLVIDPRLRNIKLSIPLEGL